MSEKPLYAAIRYFDDSSLKVHTIPVDKIIDFDEKNYSSQPFYVLRYCDALEEEEYVPAQVLAVHDDPDKLINQKKRFHFQKMRLSDAADILAEKQLLKNSANDEQSTAGDKAKNVSKMKKENVNKEWTKVTDEPTNKTKTKRKTKTKINEDNTAQRTLQEIIDNKMKTMTSIDLTFDKQTSEVSQLKKEVEELHEKNTALNITVKSIIQENIGLKKELRLKEEKVNILENKIKNMEVSKDICALPTTGSNIDNFDWEADEMHDVATTSSEVGATKRISSDTYGSDVESGIKNKKSKLDDKTTDKKNSNEDSESYDTDDYQKECDRPMEKYTSWIDSSKNGLKMHHLRYGISIPYKSWTVIRDAKTSSIFVRKLAGTLWSKKILCTKALKIEKVINEKSSRQSLTLKKKSVVKKCYVDYCKLRGLLPNNLTKKKKQQVINQWRRYLSIYISYLRKSDYDDDDEVDDCEDENDSVKVDF